MSGWLKPDWPAPPSVQAWVTTREGGVSLPPWESFNPADHVGDDPAAVAENRRRLAAVLDCSHPVQWLRQVHGTDCLRVSVAGPAATADAAWTCTPEQPLAVLTADCLPVFLCDRQGTEVAVVHAGWRGLVAGVIESALDCFAAAPADLLAWLGPAIGPQAFQVGDEVRDAFLAATDNPAAVARAFVPDGTGRFLADLYALARLRLQARGVHAVSGGGLCTLADARRFYSYRRDGVTGRMASVIVLRQGSPRPAH